MKARRIVNKLLETEDISDPKEYALSTTEPTELMRGALRDELVEKGWRHIHVRPEDEGECYRHFCPVFIPPPENSLLLHITFPT